MTCGRQPSPLSITRTDQIAPANPANGRRQTWVHVDGGRLFVEQSGKGSPIVLVHGWPLDHRVFEPQLSTLNRHFHVVTLDRRGFGRSDAPADLRQELDDIDSILANLSLDRVHLLGMSQGGRIALRFALTRPERLQSLILQSAAVDGMGPTVADSGHIPLEEYAQLVRAGRVDVVRERWMAHPMMAIDAQHFSARQLIDEIMSTYDGADLVDYSGSRYAFPLNVADALRDLQVPTLLLTGAHETSSRRAHAQKLLTLVPHIREIVFEHSGHLCNLVEPELYNRRVEEFCRDVDRNALDSGSGTLD